MNRLTQHESNYRQNYFVCAGNVASRNGTQITGNGIKLKEIVGDRLYASIPIKLQFPCASARGESEPVKIRGERGEENERETSRRGDTGYKKNKER